MSFKLNASDIIRQQERRNNKKIKSYKLVLEKCYIRIKFFAKKNDKWCFYTVPNYLVGVPLYDVNACIVYVIKKLIDGGFNVKYTHPNLIYISWDKPQKKVEPKKPEFKPIKYFDSREITYKPVEEYKPTGRFVYDNKKLNNIDKKMDFLFKK